MSHEQAMEAAARAWREKTSHEYSTAGLHAACRAYLAAMKPEIAEDAHTSGRCDAAEDVANIILAEIPSFERTGFMDNDIKDALVMVKAEARRDALAEAAEEADRFACALERAERNNALAIAREANARSMRAADLQDQIERLRQRVAAMP